MILHYVILELFSMTQLQLTSTLEVGLLGLTSDAPSRYMANLTPSFFFQPNSYLKFFYYFYV